MELQHWATAKLAWMSQLSWSTWALALAVLVLAGAITGYIALSAVAPVPRPARRSEKEYVALLPDGKTSTPQALPNWYDAYVAAKEASKSSGQNDAHAQAIETPELFMSVVVPAYNEEKRITIMLEEALEFLDKAYAGPIDPAGLSGWEIVVVSDGSRDRTCEVALDFARKHNLTESVGSEGKGSTQPTRAFRVVKLEENRGKGGAVVHGMRHVRGAYVVFADADGASRFRDLGKLVEGCDRVKDSRGRAVGIGSRAHLVGSEEVVKRSFLRNALMHSFHVILRLMTPPKTAAIADTQCGFKLFTRPALPYIVPYMHSEGWIFDVEMLMLAESANVPMVEVAIGWKEVMGSKLNVIWDSLGMAWGLAVLRAAWMTGVYKRD